GKCDQRDSPVRGARSTGIRTLAAVSGQPDDDWPRWLARWDAQQQRHIPDREERFTAMVDALAAFAGPRPRVLDLGCGPGSLSARVLDRIPGASVVAIDADPVLLAVG